MGFSFTSFVFETINFVVLVWVLSRLVYRPLKKSLAERRSAQEKLLRDAEAKSEAAKHQLEEVRRRQKELAEIRERVMQEAVEDAAAARARLLAEAREDAAAARAQGQRLLEAEREAAEAAVRELAIEQSMHIAARLLAELSPRALDDALIDRLAHQVSQYGAPIYREPGARRGAPEVDLRFARPPRDADVDRLRRAFTEALGTEPAISTREDSALVAGVVATVGDHVLDASIAGNLAVLAERARELAQRTALDG
jgi:F-type H+-transporting ATPase subunit b